MALSPSAWTPDAAVALAGADPIPVLVEARDHVLAALAPVPRADAERDQWRTAMAARIDAIGAKVAPTMSPDQGAAWRDAVISALDDLPALVVLTAAKRALRSIFRFPSEVDGEIREIAKTIIADREQAAHRLKFLMDQIRRAAEPALPSPEDVPLSPWTDDEIRRMSAEMRAIGIRCGALTQERIDEALAGWVEPEEQAA